MRFEIVALSTTGDVMGAAAAEAVSLGREGCLHVREPIFVRVTRAGFLASVEAYSPDLNARFKLRLPAHVSLPWPDCAEGMRAGDTFTFTLDGPILRIIEGGGA